jgi:lysozyme family protein
MAAATYEAAMVRVFADEGGYTNDPKDPGGATNWGITISDAQKYWQAEATPADVKAMPKAVAADIYRKHYATPLRYDDLPPGFDYSVLDAGINSGVGRAIPWAGKAIGRPVKSINDVVQFVGTIAEMVSLIQRYWAIRLTFLQGLSTWSHFGTGWGRRCARGEVAAVRMWLSIGAKMSDADVATRMDQEAAKAKSQSKKAATASVGSAAGSAASVHPSLDASHLSVSGKIALGVAIACAVTLVVYFVRQAVIHRQRAAAYTAS